MGVYLNDPEKQFDCETINKNIDAPRKDNC